LTIQSTALPDTAFTASTIGNKYTQDNHSEPTVFLSL